MVTTEQINEQKEKIKEVLTELNNLSEEDQIKEFASLVYAKITIKKLASDLKEKYESPDALCEAIEATPFIKNVAAALSTYAVIGLEMGYAGEKGKDDAVSE